MAGRWGKPITVRTVYLRSLHQRGERIVVIEIGQAQYTMFSAHASNQSLRYLKTTFPRRNLEHGPEVTVDVVIPLSFLIPDRFCSMSDLQIQGAKQ